MEKFETGAMRNTGGKGRMDLLPMCAIIRISHHVEDALTHYPERNWEKGLPMHSMLDSAIRHLIKYMDGQKDEDHLCAAATNLLMAMWTEEKHPEMQDIPSRIEEVKENLSPYARRAASLTLDNKGGTSIPASTERKEDATEGQEKHKKCKYYFVEYGAPECWGTRERERCKCGGNPEKCDFYSYGSYDELPG